MVWQRAAVLLALFSTHAFGSAGSYFAGANQSNVQILLYLNGGKFIGQKGAFQTLQTDVRLLHGRREVLTADMCHYIYNPANSAQDRIECAQTAQGYLSGVVYVVNQQRLKDSHGEMQEMRCIHRCSRRAPKVLQLTVDEDNG
jgi:hypothetical protein